MPELIADERICPYLRGRHQRLPVMQPSDNNHCIVTASIHLPGSQQSRYCLGGAYTHCPRYQQQSQEALPRYVTGIKPDPSPPYPQSPDLRTLPWRRPFFRPVIYALAILLFSIILISTWRWRVQTLPERISLEPTPFPTLSVPTPEPQSQYSQPFIGPVPRP